jgi:hypothetical protein
MDSPLRELKYTSLALLAAAGIFNKLHSLLHCRLEIDFSLASVSCSPECKLLISGKIIMQQFNRFFLLGGKKSCAFLIRSSQGRCLALIVLDKRTARFCIASSEVHF